MHLIPFVSSEAYFTKEERQENTQAFDRYRRAVDLFHMRIKEGSFWQMMTSNQFFRSRLTLEIYMALETYDIASKELPHITMKSPRLGGN